MTTRPARWAAAIGALAVLATGCTAPATTAPGTPGASAAAEGPAEIRFAWWGNPARAEATQKNVDAFMAENPDIKVVTEPGDFSGYFDKLATQAAANDAPDLITLGGAYLPEYAERGVLLDLDTVAEEFPIDQLDEGAVNNGRVDGKRYGATTGVNALAVLVNTQVFADAGVEIPDDETWTWEDYARIAKEVQAASPEGVYGSAGGLTHDSLDAWVRQRGEILYTEDGKLGLTEESLTEYFQYSLDLVKNQAAPPATVITEQVNAPIEQTLVATNKAGMAVTWSNYLSPATAASGSEMQLLKLPGESVAEPGIWLQSSQFFTINARTEFPKATAKLLSYLLNSPEAGKVVLNDRGVPTNSEVRTAIASALTETAQAEVAYIDRIGSMELQPTYIGPPGSTKVQDITNRATANVLFEMATPQEAARQWISEAEAAIA